MNVMLESVVCRRLKQISTSNLYTFQSMTAVWREQAVSDGVVGDFTYMPAPQMVRLPKVKSSV